MTSDTALQDDVDQLLIQHFAGKVVRKDLTKLLKEGANVPTYVLEYLLGSYCASDDETTMGFRSKRAHVDNEFSEKRRRLQRLQKAQRGHQPNGPLFRR